MHLVAMQRMPLHAAGRVAAAASLEARANGILRAATVEKAMAGTLESSRHAESIEVEQRILSRASSSF
tara:strand:+ start:1528 stop:1731 length:204 start_codon:yes stop_codon:yes gene_type:complete